MIARIALPILIAIVLSDLYIEWHYRNSRFLNTWKARLLWLVPGIVMTVYTLVLTFTRNFVPGDIAWIELYMMLVGILVWPKAVFAAFSFAGLMAKRIFHWRRNWGNYVGDVFIAVTLAVFFYGMTLGPRQFKVRRLDLSFPNLPASFEGYRIILFSDAHVGTFKDGRRSLLKRDVDSINAQRPDLIAFTGDLENIQPSDLDDHIAELSSLRARDGVFSVLGNHDYSDYIRASKEVKDANEQLLRLREKQFGWHLLLNEHVVLKRGNDSIYLAGTECKGQDPRPNRADVPRSMKGIPQKAFTIMLQHDPKAWDEDILKWKQVMLTLCGHTHAGQVNIFGIRPTMFSYKEDYGLYEHAGRFLYVTSGICGLVPLRIGATPEIVVITLHSHP